jgi:16S rRNA (cytosine1402-N4)-methyltransferase
MVREILTVLAPKPGDRVIDCTLGYGGHAREILAAIQPAGCLLGLDVDPIELPRTEARLAQWGYGPESVIVKRSNFAGLASVAQVFPDGADIILADLGQSSMQLDDPQRGFTFKTDVPLDMRMNPHHGQSAAALLTRISESRLASLLVENADEPRSVRLARAIIQRQQQAPLQTTGQLADAVRSAFQSTDCSDEEIKATIRRVFQAIRIAVNDEFGALDSLLRQIPHCLKTGGRVAILTFHSGEDRRVKQAFKQGLQQGVYSSVSDQVIRPSPEEQRANPRSTPAKLRHATRQSLPIQ